MNARTSIALCFFRTNPSTLRNLACWGPRVFVHGIDHLDQFVFGRKIASGKKSHLGRLAYETPLRNSKNIYPKNILDHICYWYRSTLVVGWEQVFIARDLISILYQPTSMRRVGESSTQKFSRKYSYPLVMKAPCWGFESHGRVHAMAMSKVTLSQSNSLIDWTKTWIWEKSRIQCISIYTKVSVRTSSHYIFASYEWYVVIWFQCHRENVTKNKSDVGKLSCKSLNMIFSVWYTNTNTYIKYH
jgi:hypothetical protein